MEERNGYFDFEKLSKEIDQFVTSIDEFGKEIETKDLIALKTVGDLVALAGLE